MTRSLTKIAAGCASAMVFAGAMSLSANAAYLGYGNGDPGNWDLWTEQKTNAIPSASPPSQIQRQTKAVHHAHLHHRTPPSQADKT